MREPAGPDSFGVTLSQLSVRESERQHGIMRKEELGSPLAYFMKMNGCDLSPLWHRAGDPSSALSRERPLHPVPCPGQKLGLPRWEPHPCEDTPWY